MIHVINLNGEDSIDLVMRKNQIANFDMPFFEDDDSEMVLTGTWEIPVYRDIKGTDLVKNLIQGDGVTVAGHIVVMHLGALLGLLAKGTYYFDTTNLKPDGTFWHPAPGRIVVNENIL